MRNISVLHTLKAIFLPGLILLVSLASTTLAQENQEPAQPLGDDSEFRTLHNPVISGDGAWMAAEERSERGDGNVRVWSRQGDKSFTIERGHSPRISRDSRWVSAMQKPLEETKTNEPKNKRAGQTLVLLDTRNGFQRTFEFVLSYDWTFTSTYLVYLQSRQTNVDEEKCSRDKTREPTAKPAIGKDEEGTLQVVYLNGENVNSIENVAQHITHQTHANHQTVDLVAYLTHDDQTARDTLHINAFKPGPNSGYRGNHVGHAIKDLHWASDDAILAFVDNTETTGKDGKRRVISALYTYSESQIRSGLRVFTRLDRNDSQPRALHNLVISADGAWVAAEERPDQGDGNVRVCSTKGDKTFTIERGHSPRISRDSRWVSALQKPPLEDSRTARSKNERAGQTLVLLDTQDGSQRTFDFVLSHDWTYSYDGTYTSMHLVYLQSPETKADQERPSKDDATKPATNPAAKERKVGTLHLVHMTGEGDDRMWQNVTEYATYQRSRHVAYVVHDCQEESHGHEETGRDSLHIVGFSARNSGINAIYDGEKIEGLCWARDRLMLGFLDSTETTGNDGKRRVSSAIYAWPWDQPFDTAQPFPGRWRQRFTRVDTPK